MSNVPILLQRMQKRKHDFFRKLINLLLLYDREKTLILNFGKIHIYNLLDMKKSGKRNE